jgi:sialic acid synthase SpsE
VSRLFVEAKQRPLYLIAEKSKPITTTTGVALSDEAQSAVFSSKTNGNSQ